MWLVRATVVLVVVAGVLLAAASAAVKPRIENRGSIDVVLPVDPGQYKVRLKVKWAKTRRTTTFTLNTARTDDRRCPNSTCVPLVWSFGWFDWSHPKPGAQASFSFMDAGVTARITMWRVGGPQVFDGTYASQWAKRPSTQTIWQGTDAFINYCINEAVKIYSSGGRLYCLKIGLGRLKVRPVASP
jgi:hypothetical protein